MWKPTEPRLWMPFFGDTVSSQPGFGILNVFIEQSNQKLHITGMGHKSWSYLAEKQCISIFCLTAADMRTQNFLEGQVTPT